MLSFVVWLMVLAGVITLIVTRDYKSCENWPLVTAWCVVWVAVGLWKLLT